MTQVIDLTAIPVAVEPAKKPIVFDYSIREKLTANPANGETRVIVVPAVMTPKEFTKVTLLMRDSIDGMDLFKAESKSGKEMMYLGHFNDGVV